jgi:hypothetical protein
VNAANWNPLCRVLEWSFERLFLNIEIAAQDAFFFLVWCEFKVTANLLLPTPSYNLHVGKMPWKGAIHPKIQFLNVSYVHHRTPSTDAP